MLGVIPHPTLTVLCSEPAEVDGSVAEGQAAGKRAPSERTPEPEDSAKRFKSDLIDSTKPPTAVSVS
jgi:hypothetical protein